MVLIIRFVLENNGFIKSIYFAELVAFSGSFSICDHAENNRISGSKGYKKDEHSYSFDFCAIN